MFMTSSQYKEQKELAKQLYKTPNTHLIYSHIVATKVNSIWQMDLLDVSLYDKSNSNYNWLLTLIDVYSRYVRMIPLKHKSDTPKELAKFFQNIKPTQLPENITSDNDAVFKSHETQALMKKYGIKQYFADKGDHRILGLIDRFHRTFRRNMILYMTINHTLRWIDGLEELLQVYNETPHKTLRVPIKLGPNAKKTTHWEKKISPEDVYFGRKPIHSYQNELETKKLPKLNNYVRILIELGHFDKRTMAQRWSSEVYQIIGIDVGAASTKFQLKNVHTGKTLDKRYRPYQLQVIPKPKLQTFQEPIQQQIKEERQKKRVQHELKRDEIKETNIVTEKRKPKFNKRFEDYL
jgi:Integrase core domain